MTSLLGTSVRRIEDPELLLGHGSFVANLEIPGALHVAFVRSPLAHARLTSIDTSAAASCPGVVAVYCAADLGDDPVPQFGSASPAITRSALAVDAVRFVGDPVAIVIADTRAHAADAVELVDVDYDPLPVVVGIENALAADADLADERVASNVVAVRTSGRGHALENASRVVGLRMENNRLATAPMEPHAIAVVPDGDRLTTYLGTQQPHGARDLIAKLTGLDASGIRVVAPHVGGGFGGKAGLVPDHCAVILAALRLQRPCVWLESRSENLIGMHGRGQVQYAEVGLDQDARITGVRALVLGDCGAYAGFGGAFALGTTFMMAQGCYQMPELDYTGVAVATNTAPVGAFRGAGRPEAAAMIERLIDHAAREVGLLPEEMRRRNYLRPEAFPVRTHTGVTYDNGDYDLALTTALQTADIDALRAEQARRVADGAARQLGIGIASYVEITGFGGSEYAHADVDEHGRVRLMSGTSAHGQGHATAFAMIASDVLQIPVEQISYHQSDTDLVRSGGGTGGSRSLQLGGSAVRQASVELRAKALQIAATMLEAAVDDIVLDAGGFGVSGVPGVSLTWPEVARHAMSAGEPLAVDTDFHQEGATFPFGAHVSVVEVDVETGLVTPMRHIAVDDCGTVLNPLLVAGQQQGGLAQGISQALWEEFVYDEDGNPLTSTFADYPMPSSADLMQFETLNTQTPTSLNPLGAKGIGESATVGATPAVQNAVIDALAHLGVRHVDIPCTPARVRAAIESAREEPQQVWRTPPVIASPAGTEEIDIVEI